MKPIFKIIANQNANQNDITDLIATRLIAINITNETGLVSDLCEIVLDNRDQKLEIPVMGVILEVLLGYEDQPLTKMGSYVIDDIELSSPPEQMRISGKATNSLNFDNLLDQNIRSPKNKSWHGYSLIGIISAIANNHGFKPAIDSYFRQIYIEHLDQTAESDISFLNSLARDYGAFVKFSLGRLLFFRRAIGISETGLELPTINFTTSQISNWQLKIGANQKFNKVIAKWHNFNTGKEEEVFVSDDNSNNNNDIGNSYTIRYQYTSSDRALAAAKAKLAEFKNAQENLSFTTLGNPSLAAENSLIFTDLKYLTNKNWIITRVNHVFNNQGFSSEVNAILKLSDDN